MKLVDFAKEQGLLATAALPKDEQKALGQFMTPPGVARFMSQRCLPPEEKAVVKVLEPSAGGGVLAAAVVEALLNRSILPEKIQVTLFEFDSRLIPGLKKLAEKMRNEAKALNVSLSVSIRNEDFLLSDEAIKARPIADIVIANPPYFKLAGTDPRAIAHSYAVHGQPNIYGVFMAACANLLLPNGRWCFITPRSWTNGLYFAATRRHLFHTLHIDAMHVFESRKDHFVDDTILQEAMITWATAQANPCSSIIVSSSDGTSDLAKSKLVQFPLSRVISQDNEHIISLPTESAPLDISQWTNTLSNYGLKVSTGPVVAFRSPDNISEVLTSETVPLLWMQHVKHMQITWPINKKREHIRANAATAWMLLPNENMVVMRRFSPKEDERRVTAAPYLARQLPGAMIGLENHTNYIYRPGGSLSAAETRGLAAYLNSKTVDQYFRTVAGNTQVNATDLRKLPVPPIEKIIEIGVCIRKGMSLDKIDAIVEAVLGDAGQAGDLIVERNLQN